MQLSKRFRGALKSLAAVVVALAMVLSMSTVRACRGRGRPDPGADDHRGSELADGLHRALRLLQPDRDQRAVRRRHPVARLGDPTSTTIYQPQQYRPGLMRGAGAYDVQMTNAGNGYWVTDVPLAAGPNQYWFYVNNNTSLWITDPANAPIYAPDGLTGTARRAFNKVNVPYDAEKQNYAPLAERVIANPRPDSAEGHVELCADPDRHGHADAGRLPAAGL